MRRNKSIILSSALALGIFSFNMDLSAKADDTGSLSFSETTKISRDNIKNEDISSSLTKPEIPKVESIDIEEISKVKPMIDSDWKGDIQIPQFVLSTDTSIKGRLSKGVSVAVYKLTNSEVESKKFIPSSENLITDSKFSVTSEDGSFNLPLKDVEISPNTYLGISISYPAVNSLGNHINKTYVVKTRYVSIGQQKVGVSDTLDISKIMSFLPEGSKYEVISNVDTKTPGNRILKVRVEYDGVKTDLSIPVLVGIDDSNPYRISGDDRYKTNIESVRKNFKKGDVKTAIITSGSNFADPLSAGPLAMKMKSPIIFSSKDGLSEDALAMIKELGVEEVIVVGGENSVPKSVEEKLKGIRLRRISGVDRYETSKKILHEFGTSSHIVFVDGRKFADALSATPLSKKLNSPILLVSSTEDIDQRLGSFLDAYIVGGKKSVSEKIETAIKSVLVNKPVYRVYGKDREQTSAQVAKEVKYGENILANGSSFADALSSINLLNNGGKNLLLVSKDKLSEDVRFLVNNRLNYIIGGENSVSKSIFGY